MSTRQNGPQWSLRASSADMEHWGKWQVSRASHLGENENLGEGSRIIALRLVNWLDCHERRGSMADLRYWSSCPIGHRTGWWCLDLLPCSDLPCQSRTPSGILSWFFLPNFFFFFFTRERWLIVATYVLDAGIESRAKSMAERPTICFSKR